MAVAPSEKVATSARSTMFHRQTAPLEPPVAIQSMPPAAMVLPSGRNASDSIEQPSRASGIRRIASPSATRQIQTDVPCAPPEASVLPSRLKARVVVGSSGPSQSARCLPFASQRRTFLLTPPAMRFPSGLNASECSGSVESIEVASLFEAIFQRRTALPPPLVSSLSPWIDTLVL